MSHDLDVLARSVHELVTDIAAHQVSREIAHLADITVDADGASVLVAPAGLTAPSTGAITTHVLARSHDVPDATVEMRVAVWIAEPGSDGAALVLTRGDDDRSLQISVDEVEPEATPHLRGRINDYVALIIAHMVAELNVAMQRSYAHESAAQTDLAEYEA